MKRFGKETTSSPGRWRALKIAVFSLTPAVILVVVAEATASMVIARRAAVTPHAKGGSVYSLQVGRGPWSRLSVTPLNSLGFPDEEFPPAGQRDACARVIFAGDSFILGDGVHRDSNFVEIVRRRVSGRQGRCVRVFNLGIRGTTIDRQGEAIRRLLDRLQPDVVILGQYQNDLTDLNGPGAVLDPNRNPDGSRRPGDSVRVRMKIFQSSLVKFLTYRMVAVMIERDVERDLLRRWSVVADTSRRKQAELFQETYGRIYGELVDTLRRRGVRVGALIIPSKLDVLAGRYPEEPFFVSIAERHSVPHLRLFAVLDQRRSPMPFLMYDGHLNEHGNRVVADALHEWLFVSEESPFTDLLAQ